MALFATYLGNASISAPLGDTIRPTYPSKDFVRLVGNMRNAARDHWGDIIPLPNLQGVPYTPPDYAEQVLKALGEWVTTGEADWGAYAFPAALSNASAAYDIVEKAKKAGAAFLLPVDTNLFWKFVFAAAVDLGSKDFSVTPTELVVAFVEGAREGWENLRSGFAFSLKWLAVGAAAVAVIYVAAHLKRD